MPEVDAGFLLVLGRRRNERPPGGDFRVELGQRQPECEEVEAAMMAGMTAAAATAGK